MTSRKLTVDESKQQALYEIYQFYAKMHVKRDIAFEEQSKVQRIDMGEFISFCKDFKITLPKTTLNKIFKKVSPNMQELTLDQFKESLPHLGMYFGRAKALETKHRLAHIKACLEYPKNQEPVSEVIELLINAQTSKYDHLGRKHKSNYKHHIQEIINNVDLNIELEKSEKIR